MTTQQNKTAVTSFINDIWNERKMHLLDNYVHQDYEDYTFPATTPPTKDHFALWIQNTSKAFEHHTKIESILAEEDEVAIRISFKAKHIGTWRNIEATGREVAVKGFRFFKLRDGKVIKHWALIDGEALQTKLSDTYHGCALKQN